MFGSGAPRFAFGGSALGQQVRVVAEAAASRLRLGEAIGSDELVRATFTGPPPEVKTVDGVVTMRYSRRLLDARSRLADVALHPAVPLVDRARRGRDRSRRGPRALGRLPGLDIRGGANHVHVRLGAPDGGSGDPLAGGASTIRFDRPRACRPRSGVRGGVSRLRFDGQKIGGVGGDRRISSPSYAKAPDRYELDLAGGVSRLVIEEE